VGATNDGGAFEAGVAFLRDGEWHPIAQVINAMAKVIPPGVASRRGFAPVGAPDSMRIANGQYKIAQERLSSAIKRGRWEADQPYPLGRDVYSGAAPCRIRDTRADTITSSTLMKELNRSTQFLQERPGLSAAIPWVFTEPVRRLRRSDVPKVAELIKHWVEQEHSGLLQLSAQFRAATEMQRREIMAYVRGLVPPAD
jgi:hypothetical protein